MKPWRFGLLLLLSACGGKVVFEGSGGNGAGNGATGGGGDETCAPSAVDLPVDGDSTVEGPAPLDQAASYGLLRGLHSGQPEGERFTIQTEGHLLRAQAILFAPDQAGDVVAEVFLVCGTTRSAVLASARVPKSTMPFYDGIHSELWVSYFELDAPVPVHTGDTIDVLFHPETTDVVSAVHTNEVYTFGGMVGEAEDLSYLGDFAVQLAID